MIILVETSVTLAKHSYLSLEQREGRAKGFQFQRQIHTSVKIYALISIDIFKTSEKVTLWGPEVQLVACKQ